MGIKISQAFPSNWLKADDLKGKKVHCIMREVSLETIGDEDKPVLYFEGKEKGLVLNKTNAGRIALGYGDDTDSWAGKDIMLYPEMVQFQGRMVPSIRVSVPIPEATNDEPIPF